MGAALGGMNFLSSPLPLFLVLSLSRKDFSQLLFFDFVSLGSNFEHDRLIPFSRRTFLSYSALPFPVNVRLFLYLAKRAATAPG